MDDQASRNKDIPPSFAHPIEKQFACILDFYGIKWIYEPQTFPLQWDPSGKVSEAFTPDFYLPEQNLFVELTTLRPQLTTQKNRKMRRLKELYPYVNIKMFKRRDLRDLMMKYGLDHEAGKLNGTEAKGI